MGLFGFGKTKDDNPVEIELSLFTRSSSELKINEDAIPNHTVAIDDQTRKNLKIKWNDYVEIKGKRKTVAMCVRIHSDHAGMGKILVSELCVINLGFVEFESHYNAKVTVRKIKPVKSEGIIFFPISKSSDLQIIDERYLYRYLDGISLIKGDKIAFDEVSEGHSPVLEVIQVVSYDNNKDGDLSAKNFDSTNAVLISEKTSLHIAQNVTKIVKKYTKGGLEHYEESTYQRKKIEALPDKIKSIFGKSMDDILYDVPHLSFLPQKSRKKIKRELYVDGIDFPNRYDSSYQYFELRVVERNRNGGRKDDEKITLNEEIWKKLNGRYIEDGKHRVVEVKISFPGFGYHIKGIDATAIEPFWQSRGVNTYDVGIPTSLRNQLGVDVGDYVFVSDSYIITVFP